MEAVAAVILEGGAPANPLQEMVSRVRGAVVLDTLEKIQQVDGFGPVILGTDRPALAAAARQLGVEVAHTGGQGRFHFGQVLQRICRQRRLDQVLYMGGAALPLLDRSELAWVIQTLAEHERCVVVNNPQSADLIAFRPASVMGQVPLPRSDNSLGWALRDAGLERVLMPSSPRVHFDLDTPTDFLILDLSGQAGPRAQAALAQLPWDRSRLLAAQRVLGEPYQEIGLVGRVGTPAVDFLNAHCQVRLRLFSEERGMKALGREERGEVVSLVGDLVDELGPQWLFDRLASVCRAVFFDSRVVFAHRGRRVSEWDRFHSDLGQVEAVQDPFVREFTRVALACGAPVVLGGHSVVAGGLQVLAGSAIG